MELLICYSTENLILCFIITVFTKHLFLPVSNNFIFFFIMYRRKFAHGLFSRACIVIIGENPVFTACLNRYWRTSRYKVAITTSISPSWSFAAAELTSVRHYKLISGFWRELNTFRPGGLGTNFAGSRLDSKKSKISDPFSLPNILFKKPHTASENLLPSVEGMSFYDYKVNLGQLNPLFLQTSLEVIP